MKDIIIVTGASSGIGQALTICFAKSGHKVLAIGRNEIALNRTKSLSEGDNVIPIVADLSKDSELDKVIEKLTNDDQVKYLIHCAATTQPYEALSTIARSQLEDTINTNVMAPIFLTQKLAPYFDKTTRIMFIGSDYVGVNNKIRPGIAGAYGISKSALRVAVEYFRHEYKDIALIGYLNPGSTDTPMFHAMKAAVTSQLGVFNNSIEPTSSTVIAEFIQAVLEKSTDQDYSAIDWDFRTAEHQDKVIKNEVGLAGRMSG